MNLSEHFWKEFYQLKVHAYYVELHLVRTEMIDRSLKILLAITSSTSIGAWVIWREYAIVWGSVIAISQVITAIGSVLPYRERLKAFAGLLGDLEELAVYTEMKWLEISRGMLTEAEIAKSLSDIRSRKHKLLKKHFPSTVIPANGGFIKKAEQLTNAYLQVFYATPGGAP